MQLEEERLFLKERQCDYTGSVDRLGSFVFFADVTALYEELNKNFMAEIALL
jgi:hypothetical protein